MDDSKNSFVVSVLLRSEHVPPLSTELQRWQELVVAVDAFNEEDALKRAMTLARQSECTYFSVTGDQVRWIVEGVAGVWASQAKLPDNIEVFSRFLRMEEGQSLLKPLED